MCLPISLNSSLNHQSKELPDVLGSWEVINASFGACLTEKSGVIVAALVTL